MLRRALRSIGLLRINKHSLVTSKLRITRSPHIASLITAPKHNFTSTSGPSQVAVLEQVQGKVFQVLKMAAKCNQQKLSTKATFQQLGFDSLDSVELIVAMEELFGFDITNQEAERISTVDQAIKVFYKHMNDRIANKLSNPTASDVQQGTKK